MTDFTQYIKSKWVLAPLKIGEKSPRGKGWNRRELCLSTVEDVKDLKAAGLCHAYSGTCCLDVDNIEESRKWLKERGIDLDAMLNDPSVIQIKSGRPNRTKLLYRMPTQPVASAKIITTVDGVKTNILDFRCATKAGMTVQDALPPSPHPDTGKPYYWEFDDLVADWSDPPILPPDILAIWLAHTNEASEEKAEVEKAYDEETLTPLLEVFDPDTDYNNWINVGMALHHATKGGEAGLEVWDEWSQQGEKYNGRKELETHWSSFRGSGITIDYLLMHQVAGADDFENDPPPREGQEKTEKEPLFKIEHVSDWVNHPPPKWLVRNVLPQADMAMIFGDPGSGKSFLALDIAMAVSGSSEWWEKRTDHGPVLWVAAEAAGSVRNRALAYAKHHRQKLEENDLWIIGDTPNFSKVDDIRQLAKAAKQIDPRMIVVDTMTAAAGGANENSGEDMAVILAACRALHNITHALVLLIHHSGKDKTKGARGWSGIKAAMQTMIEVTHEEETGERNATIHKQRDGEEGVDFPFRLHPVTLPKYDNEEQVSCVVQSVEGVDMFKPELHPAWASLAMVPFISQGSESIPLEEYEAQIRELCLSVGVESDMIDEHYKSLLDSLSDAGHVSLDDDITFVGEEFVDL